jgi:hypothetical protein
MPRGFSDTTSPSDDLLKRAIGRAEGTRDRNGNPTAAFQGHKDPGWSGRCKNQGSFSYQHCASSPDEADRKWLEVLRKAEGTIQAQAQEKFGQPLSLPAMVAALDGYTQSPDAGGKRFVKHLPTADPSPEQLIAASTAALKESRQVLGGPPMNVAADQQRQQVHFSFGRQSQGFRFVVFAGAITPDGNCVLRGHDWLPFCWGGVRC